MIIKMSNIIQIILLKRLYYRSKSLLYQHLVRFFEFMSAFWLWCIQNKIKHWHLLNVKVALKCFLLYIGQTAHFGTEFSKISILPDTSLLLVFKVFKEMCFWTGLLFFPLRYEMFYTFKCSIQKQNLHWPIKMLIGTSLQRAARLKQNLRWWMTSKAKALPVLH